MKIRPNQQMLESMSRNPDNWKGIFYYNRKDPRLMVPKQIPSLGWTFNFASPYVWITLGGIILIAIASSYFL